MYLVDAADWEAVSRVHGEIFGTIRPATTLVIVAALVDPRWRLNRGGGHKAPELTIGGTGARPRAASPTNRTRPWPRRPVRPR